MIYLTPLFEFNEASTNLQWSADGKELMGGAFSVWDTQTGQRLAHWDALKQFYFEPDAQPDLANINRPVLYKVIPSPDGNFVASIASKIYSGAGGLHSGSTKLNISNARTGVLIREIPLSNLSVQMLEGGENYNFAPTYFQWNSTGSEYTINTINYTHDEITHYNYDFDNWSYLKFNTISGVELARGEFVGSHYFFQNPKLDYMGILYRDLNVGDARRYFEFVSATDFSTDHSSILSDEYDQPKPFSPFGSTNQWVNSLDFGFFSDPSWNSKGTDFRVYYCYVSFGIWNNGAAWGARFSPDTLKLRYFDADTRKDNVCQAAWNADDSKTAEIKLASTSDPDENFNRDSILRVFDQTNQKVEIVKTDAEIAQLGLHTSNVYSLKLNPSSKQIISASRDGTIRFSTAFCESTCLGLPKLTRPDNVYAAIPDPTGIRIATAGTNGTIEISSLATGQLERSLTGHTFTIRNLDWSPDGLLLASASWDGTARIWNPSTGETNFVLSSHTEPVNAVAFSPNGQILATASSDHTIKFWNPTTGLELSQLTQHTDAVFALAWSPDGTKLASAGADKTIRIWDAATGALLQTLDKNYGAVRAIKWINDQMILSGGEDATLRGWRISDGKLMFEQATKHKTIFSLEYNPANQSVFVGSFDGNISMWGLK